MSDLRSETGHNIDYQRVEWTVQRIGWAVMGLVVLAAIIGLLGSGALSKTSASTADGTLQLEYPRIARHHQPRLMTLTVSPEYVQDGEVQVWIDLTYARQFGVQSVIPEAESMQTEPDRIVYTFEAGEANAPVTITWFYQHDHYWIEHGEIGIVDGPSIAFSQLVMP